MPRDPQPTKNRILASAERLFAANGFDGVSMREIAADANAQLALIHYHFGTKLDLYRAIWALRYTEQVANPREKGLASIDYDLPVPKLIRFLVELYLLPLLRMTEIEELKAFVAIGARECTDPKEAERGILQEFLDCPAKRFIEHFGKAMPELSPAEIAWGYQAMLGVSIQYIADRSRITRISGGAAQAGDTQSAMKPLIEFCVSGWLGLWEARTRGSRKKPLRSNSRQEPRPTPHKLKNKKERVGISFRSFSVGDRKR
jgi:AcrR family transcriptional regulator